MSIHYLSRLISLLLQYDEITSLPRLFSIKWSSGFSVLSNVKCWFMVQVLLSSKKARNHMGLDKFDQLILTAFGMKQS